MRWAGFEAPVGQQISACSGFLVGIAERYFIEVLGVDEKVIL
jgi:hypothetical protein